jgi:putative transposase
MKDNSSIFPIEKMCSVFKISRSGYYNWLHSKPSRRFIENKEITKRILSIHAQSKQTYGSPRITALLKKESIEVSRARVARLMRKAKVQSKRRRRFKVTTDSRHKYPVVPNQLNRNFRSETIGQVWVSDITYIFTREGWLYLTTVLDLADRKVIGWALSKTMRASDTSIAAFKMAVTNRPLTGELIFHSDRGVQYACNEFSSHLEGDRRIIRSMSRKGDCWDNAVAESFFKTFKSDMVYERDFKTIKEAQLATFEYIEIWYNKRRLHSSLGYRTPEEMERFLVTKKLAA